MTITLALIVLLLTATSPQPDAKVGEGDRLPVAGGEQDEGTSGLETVVLDGECPAYVEKTGGGPSDCVIARIADHPRSVSRRIAPPTGITSHRPRGYVRLRC